jgi:hypothetical protein
MPSVTAEPKSTIFFSVNASDNSWRFIEKVVAIIELQFQGRDNLDTYSSKKINNIVGDTEELDVVYSDISDPSSVFNFVQVRDRDEIEGRPWVQQILGQRATLGINAGILVSTSSFSKPAIRSAQQAGIPLRVLQNETRENTIKWFTPDTVGVFFHSAIVDHCSIVVNHNNNNFEFRADKPKCSDNNILVSTTIQDEYNMISLNKVFDVDVTQNNPKYTELFEKIPKDGIVHNTTAVANYSEPHLFLKVNPSEPDKEFQPQEIVPISAIVFYIQIVKQMIDAPITKRYKYVDAINDKCIAQAIVAETKIDNQTNYLCLVKHRYDGEKQYLNMVVFQ